MPSLLICIQTGLFAYRQPYLHMLFGTLCPMYTFQSAPFWSSHAALASTWRGAVSAPSQPVSIFFCFHLPPFPPRPPYFPVVTSLPTSSPCSSTFAQAFLPSRGCKRADLSSSHVPPTSPKKNEGTLQVAVQPRGLNKSKGRGRQTQQPLLGCLPPLHTCNPDPSCLPKDPEL